jgi:core-2/I-Branching enzyme
MKLAYIIQAHKGFKQLSILIDILSKNSDVYLHIDLKNDYLYNQLKDHYLSQKNIFILSDRISVNWSGFSQVKATLNLLEAVRGKNYDYVTLLSGQDLPIKSHSEIISFLSEDVHREFIHIAPDYKKYCWRLLRYSPWSESKSIRNFPMNKLNSISIKLQNLLNIKKPFFKDLDIYMGSSWFTITNNAVEYILDSIDDKLIVGFESTTCSDEHFIQTLLMNSPFKEKVVGENTVYIDWSEGNPNPKILTMDDYLKLKNSTKLFARKFDIDIDADITNKIIKDAFI